MNPIARKLVAFFGATFLSAVASSAQPLKVDLNGPEHRGDVVTPRWQNWACSEGASISQTFGAVTVTLRATAGNTLVPVLYKGTLDFGATMASDGVVTKSPNGAGIELVLHGLTPGEHTVVTYHN